MAEETAVSGKSGATDKGTTGNMGVSAGVGPAARMQARYQLREQGGKQHKRLAAAAAAAAVLKLPFQPLSFAAACVWFRATVRRLVLSLPAVIHVIEPFTGRNVP